MTLDDLKQRVQTLISSETTEMGHYRFARRLIWLIPHLQDAAGSNVDTAEGSGKRFYDSRHAPWGNARNALFQLQALARIYRKTHRGDVDIFERLKAEFKALEDALGRIDYFDEMSQQADALQVDSAVVDHLNNHKTRELNSLTQYLLESEWVVRGDVGTSPALARILADLDSVKWRSAKKDRAKILKFFNKELEKVCEKSAELDFEELEDGVHEFRRTARWISIYAQCLGGLMKLVGKENLAIDLSDYHTTDIVNAPYTNYPFDRRESHTIELDASLIFAFNWLISTIGDIKDDGQLEEALVLAMVESGVMNEQAAHEAIGSQLGSDRTALADIPEEVVALVDRFVDVHKVPQRLQKSLDEQ